MPSCTAAGSTPNASAAVTAAAASSRDAGRVDRGRGTSSGRHRRRLRTTTTSRPRRRSPPAWARPSRNQRIAAACLRRDGGGRRVGGVADVRVRPPLPLEDARLRRRVRVHRPVPVQVVRRQVQQDRHLRMEPVDVEQLERRGLDGQDVPRLARRQRERVPHVPAGAGLQPRRRQHRREQLDGRRLAVRPGHRQVRDGAHPRAQLELAPDRELPVPRPPQDRRVAAARPGWSPPASRPPGARRGARRPAARRPAGTPETSRCPAGRDSVTRTRGAVRGQRRRGGPAAGAVPDHDHEPVGERTLFGRRRALLLSGARMQAHPVPPRARKSA